MAFLDEPGLNQAFIEIGNRLKKKANSSDVNTSVANINTELGKKANKVDVSAALVGKADKTYVDTELGKKANSSDVTSKLNEKIASSEKGEANGVATLGQDGLIPSSQLPSYVDDVIEGYYYNNNFYKDFNSVGVTDTPATVGNNQLVYQDNSSADKSKYQITFNNVITPESGKIYVCKPLNDNNITILKGNNYNNDSICYRYTGSGYVPISDVPKDVITNIESLSNQIKSLQHNARNLVYISWSSLKELRDNGKLIEGTQYRITDYQCTTVQEDTKSAGHQFDIIVTADSNNKLNEVARAIQHDGDTYFSKSKLEAWKIWYRLDNDTTHFAWADATNGKGVIYRMIDEFNNDIPYDFKNIQFKHPKDTTKYPYYYYTFASSNIEDNTDYSLSISNNCYSNVIKEYVNSGKRTLNQIIFIGSRCHSNTFGSDCLSITFEENCFNNTFGFNCFRNYFRYMCHSNTFGSDCNNNTFGYNNWHNNFGDGCGSNTFGNIFSYNTFGPHCSNNTFVTYASGSTLVNCLMYNKFESGIKFCTIVNPETSSFNNQVQNYHFKSSMIGTSSNKIVIEVTRNLPYDTTVALNSTGEVKTYCEADLIL